MPISTGVCESCSAQFNYRFKGTLMCLPCRILNEHKGTSPRKPKECTDCGKQFWAIRRSYKVCYTCDDLKAGNHKTTPCNICHKRNRIAYGVAETCLGCVQSSETMRSAYLKALKKLRLIRRGEGPTEP